MAIKAVSLIPERYKLGETVYSKETNYQNAIKFYKKEPGYTYWTMSNEKEFEEAKKNGRSVK